MMNPHLSKNCWVLLPLALLAGGCDGDRAARHGKPTPAQLLPAAPEAPVKVEIPTTPAGAPLAGDPLGLTLGSPDNGAADGGEGGAGQQAERPADSAFVGLKVEQAEALAKQHKIRARVVMVDGVGRMVTEDYSPERLNFTVEKGVVTKVTRG